MKSNIHIHTELCGHAEGLPVDYVKQAVALNYDAIGISDHCPFVGDGVPERMKFELLPEYVRLVNEAKKQFEGKIKVYTGLEAEYFSCYRSYYDWLLEKGQIEYLILGQHYAVSDDCRLNWLFDRRFSDEWLTIYVGNVIEAMKTGMFSCIAHPDLYTISDITKFSNFRQETDRLINAALKEDAVLELNANGIRKGLVQFESGERYQYSTDIFWREIAKANVKVVIGADAHLPEVIYDEAVRECEELADNLKLNLITNPIECLKL